LLVCSFLPPPTVGAQTTKEWNFSDWTAESIVETKTIDGLTVYATSNKSVTIDAGSATVDDATYTRRLKFGGKGAFTGEAPNKAPSNRVLKFDVTGACEIYVVLTSSNKTGTGRNLVIETSEGATVGSFEAPAGSVGSHTYSYTVNAAATLYVYSDNSGINLYDIKVTYPSYVLDFGTYEWKSLCLDFDATIPDGVEAYTGKLNDDQTVVKTTKIIDDDSEDKVLPANTPVLVKKIGDATSYYIYKKGETTNTYSSDLKGVTEQFDLTALQQEGKVVLTFGVDANNVYGFRKPANTYIAANKAYLLVGSAQANKAIGLSFDGNTSTINAISATPTTTDAPAYNIMGQRVGANAKGLIIKGGRKYIVK